MKHSLSACGRRQSYAGSSFYKSFINQICRSPSCYLSDSEEFTNKKTIKSIQKQRKIKKKPSKL